MDILLSRLDCIQEAIKQKTDEFKKLVWTEGILALAKRMKDCGVNQVYLRRAEEDGYFATEELWFFHEDGRFAAQSINLNDNGELMVKYTTLTNQEESYESNWEYGFDVMESPVTKKISDQLIMGILPTVLKQDDDFFSEYSVEEE